MDIDAFAERLQMFDETWRLMDRNFYDPDFHGADWKAMPARYRPIALASACPEDFCDAVKMMLGEINASHLGIYPPDRGGERDETGSLGVDFDPDHDGKGPRIASVLPDGPAGRKESGLRPGDVILSVGGEAVGRSVNIHRLLNHTAGKRVLLATFQP